jgi:hypothetical protein
LEIQSYRRILFEPTLPPFVLNSDITINGLTHLIIEGPIDLMIYDIRIISCSNIIICSITFKLVSLLAS